MRCTTCTTLALGLGLAASVQAAPSTDGYKHSKKPDVEPHALVEQIYESDLREGAYVLQGISTENNNTRAFGTPGHEATLDYIRAELGKSGYYKVTTQEFETYNYTPFGNSTFEAGGTVYPVATPEFSLGGEVSATIVKVANLGCDPSDYPASVAGQIALVARGTCEFGLKVAVAQSQGAAAVVISNNDEEEPDAPAASVTLSAPPRPEGEYLPTVSISLNAAAAIQDGAPASIGVFAETKLVTTANIIADTHVGDPNNVIVLTSHTDSVLAGPGINDDGSGTVALLTLATKLSMYNVKNAVRFIFCTAEEAGLIGSTYYVENLSQSELSKIRMDLNFDMLASPNYVFTSFDGSGAAFGQAGPDGSDQIEDVFQKFFAERDIPLNATAFDGRSDYGPFIDVGIPAGGLFTGAEEIKTEREASIWGGEAGVALDVNYHKVGDDINNLNYYAWLVNAKGAAYTMATYAKSLEGFPANNATVATPERKRSIQHKRSAEKHHSEHACGPKPII